MKAAPAGGQRAGAQDGDSSVLQEMEDGAQVGEAPAPPEGAARKEDVAAASEGEEDQQRQKQQQQQQEQEEEDDGGIGFFNPDMFTDHVELECDAFQFGDLRTELAFIHDSNQLVDRFVSRVVWPSAQAMCSYFVANPSLVAGKRVVELGSGTGLCGIVMAQLGATHVAMTDYNEEALSLIRDNVARNGVEAKCSCHQLTWGDAAGAAAIIAACGGEPFDVVLGTDVVYEPECVHPLVGSACALMEPETGLFYLANHTHRYGRLEASVKKTILDLSLSEAVMPSFESEDGRVDFSVIRRGPGSAQTSAPPAAEPAHPVE